MVNATTSQAAVLCRTRQDGAGRDRTGQYDTGQGLVQQLTQVLQQPLPPERLLVKDVGHGLHQHTTAANLQVEARRHAGSQAVAKVSQAGSGN